MRRGFKTSTRSGCYDRLQAGRAIPVTGSAPVFTQRNGSHAMKPLELPPIPAAMAGKQWKIVYMAGAFLAWGLLVYGLYIA